MNPDNNQQIGSYLNSMTPATDLSLASRNSQSSSSSQLPSAEEEMQRQLDEFNRSVTIIIWYKANTDPIRLQQILPTFPYFQLSRFSTLVTDLGLTSSSYLDTYIPMSRHWEQHTISSVRIVDTQQRLLYKLRRSLIDGLSEDECVSFREEIRMQSPESDPGSSHTSASANGSTSSSRAKKKQQAPPSITIPNQGIHSRGTLKRPAPESDAQNPGHSSKIHISDNYYASNSGETATVTSEIISPISGLSSSDTSPTVADSQSNSQDNDIYVYQQPVFYRQASTNTSRDHTPVPQYPVTSANATTSIPYHPHPPLKRWPNDYTVSQISSGFHAMDVLVSQSSSNSNMTQRIAFERVFGSRYVKSTVCRHRAVWRRAHQTLREEFESMGTDDRALWGEFVRRVEGRPRGKNAGRDMSPPTTPTKTQNTTLHYQTPTNGKNVRGQDPVMNSRRNQVDSTPNTSMESDTFFLTNHPPSLNTKFKRLKGLVDPYDGSRTRLSNGAG